MARARPSTQTASRSVDGLALPDGNGVRSCRCPFKRQRSSGRGHAEVAARSVPGRGEVPVRAGTSKSALCRLGFLPLTSITFFFFFLVKRHMSNFHPLESSPFKRNPSVHRPMRVTGSLPVGHLPGAK